MDCSTPGFPVHHELLELAQTQVHRVGDAIQPSHSLSSPSPPAFNLSQHQGLFQWVSSSHQVAVGNAFSQIESEFDLWSPGVSCYGSRSATKFNFLLNSNTASSCVQGISLLRQYVLFFFSLALVAWWDFTKTSGKRVTVFCSKNKAWQFRLSWS